MGFDIREDGDVVVYHDHNRFAVTRVEGNPSTVHSACGLTVRSIFKRLPHRSKGWRKELQDDNCPMIYALKNKQYLYTTVSGRNANGRTSWQVGHSGQTYGNWQEQQLEEVVVDR